MKHIHRQILTSAAYQQSSFSIPMAKPQSVDPDNLLLWRQNPRRLDAESLRDSLLAVSGRLLPVHSGPPRWHAIPESVRRGNPATLDDNGRLQNWYTTEPEEANYVRTVFTVQKRTITIPFLEPLDAPDTTRSCGLRETTIVAPQASTLMNSPFALAMSQAFAERVQEAAGPELEAQICQAFLWAFGRTPKDKELAAARDLLNRHEKTYSQARHESPGRDCADRLVPRLV